MEVFISLQCPVTGLARPLTDEVSEAKASGRAAMRAKRACILIGTVNKPSNSMWMEERWNISSLNTLLQTKLCA